MKDKYIFLWPDGAPFAKGNGLEDCPRITPYLVPLKKHAAAVIVCPGGGYQGRAEHEGGPIAEWLNKIGISAFVLDYRVAPYKYPCPLLDAQRAIRYVRSNAEKFGIDAGRVGILGFSAGGHLASTAGTHYDAGKKDSNDPVDQESCRPDLMILCYPVVTFGELRHDGSMVNLLGENPPQDMRDLLSGEKQITGDTPPAFLWHTGDDEVRPENSMLFALAMKKCNVPFEIHVFESGQHGLGLAMDNPYIGSWTKLCEIWLKKRGFV
jgi:acetyl esterase/lipase